MKIKIIKNWKKSLLIHDSTIKDAIKSLSKSSLRICVVIDKKKNLIGIINDGDIRRGLSAGLTLDSKIIKTINKSPVTIKKNDIDDQILLNKIKQLDINLVPLINTRKKVIGLVNLNSQNYFEDNNSEIVILSGGMGKRLRPTTLKTPKALVRINGKSVIDIIFEKIGFFGFVNFNLMLKYKSKKIIDHIKKKSNKNFNYQFFTEKKYLGTAGSLFYLKNKIKKNFIVTNCDIISEINYLDFLEFHNKNRADLTLAAREIESREDFGVLKSKGIKLLDVVEKPVKNIVINCGIYALNPKILKLIRKNSKFDMVSLVKEAINKKYKVLVYHSYENWIDIGSHKSLKVAKNIVMNSKFKNN